MRHYFPSSLASVLALFLACVAPLAAQEQFETLDPGPLPRALPPKPAPVNWRQDAGDVDPVAQIAAITKRRPETAASRAQLRRLRAALQPMLSPPSGDLSMRRRHAAFLAARRGRAHVASVADARGAASELSQATPPKREFLQVEATPVYFAKWRLQAEHEYVIETRNLSHDSDSVLYVLSDGRQVAMNDDRTREDPSSLVRFQPEVSGEYLLLVRAREEALSGRCDLYIDGQVRQQGISFGGADVTWDWQPGDRFQTAHLPSTYARPVDTLLFAFDGLDLVGWNDNGGIRGCSAVTLAEASHHVGAHVLVACASPDPADADWVTVYRNALSEGDADEDGLSDPLEASLGTDPLKIDTDGDGLRDDWELFGVHTPMGDEDLPSYAGTGINSRRGSDPLVPDLFLEIDWMTGTKKEPNRFRPLDRATDLVTEQFWKSGGIALHIDLGQMGTSPTRGGQVLPYQESFDRTGTEPLSLESCYASGDWFSPSRRHLFAYMICASRFPDRTSSGHMVRFNEDGSINQTLLFNSTLNPAAIVCMGTAINGSLTLEAGTIMHEFGHCLNLQHGGFESYNNYKPNYTSSMNYLFQFWGVDAGGAPDYSHGDNPALDERRLDERQGVGNVSDQAYSVVRKGRSQPVIPRRDDVRCEEYPTAFDWDDDGQISAVPVQVDFNADGWYGLLRDFDDWSEVRRAGGGMKWIGTHAAVDQWISATDQP